MKSFLAGGTAGAVSKTMVAPIERIKTILQVERLTLGRTSSIPVLAVRVFTQEGIVAFWRGNLASVIRIIPNKGILFMSNDVYRQFLSIPGSPLSDVRQLIAGGLSGATNITLTYPLDFVQARLATTTKNQYKGILDCLVTSIRAEGVRAIYKGYWPSLLGIAPYAAVQFYSFDKLKKMVADNQGRNTAMQIACVGGISGAVAQSITYPMDTVRKRLQVQGGKAAPGTHYTGTWECMVKITKQEGLRGFYRGGLTNLFRAVPSQAVQFTVVEWMKNRLNVQYI
jgi:solute carrier family 25 phosphate transporter 23/24/25/41